MTTSPPQFLLHPSVNAPGEGIWFATPAGFTDLPLEALVAPLGAPEAKTSAEALSYLLASAPDEMIRQRFIAQLATAQRMFHALQAEGTVHCSLGLHRDDTGDGDGGALLSLFTITWVGIARSPRGATAARAVATAERHTHVEYAELPCGPATFSETVRTATGESGLPQDPLLQIHAHLPHPDGASLALLTLSTTAVAHREHYRAFLRHIANLVSFESPFGPVSEDEGSRRT
ncbi:hypothetical protein FE633_28405 [Streptomyces montanus]|uniref:Uncharacterized protein n=2 Tax=Streptomyces montanus TaxID=2580423 RepID=A0A5R9FLS4_9ACTN|nr:hypothetical protein FE633_28405 [Streptomyces montanus]